MNWTLDHILKTIAERDFNAPRWGIGTAKQYLGDIQPCLSGGGICPSKVFGTASADAWKKELAAADSRLTYCDAGMADGEYLQKSIRDGSDITSGAILEYDAVLSTTRKDRDSDILESGGLDIDTKMSLLWQHIQVSPVGKHVSVLKQTDDLVICRFAIADTELGRDAATLTRFGALRKSHGFKPTEFEPVEIVKSADGKDIVRGWHVKRASVLEGSLVSIPANVDGNILRVYEKEFDGVCTAFSRGELRHDLAKSWAKGIYDQRPAQSQGMDLSTKSAVEATKQQLLDAARREIESESKNAGEKMAADRKCEKCDGKMKDGKCSKCGYMHRDGGKSAGDVKTKNGGDLLTKDVSDAMDTPYLPGSWEAIEWQLRRTASNYLISKGKIERDSGYASVLGTFADNAIVCYRDYGRENDRECYRIGWKTDDDGKAMWDGEPTEVKIEVGVMEKHFDGIDEHAADLTTKKFGELADGENEQTTGGGDDSSLDTLARQLAAKSFAADGDEGVRALEIAADAAVVLKRQREIDELQSLLM